MKKIALIGAPSSVGTHIPGAAMGPYALRIAGLSEALNARGWTVEDKGNLDGPACFSGEIKNGWRNLNEVSDWNRLICHTVTEALQQKHLPILLGGDHSLVIGSISAVAAHQRAQNKKLRVLWFDAHTDANTAQISPSGNIHGMPVACLLGHGPDSLTKITQTTALQAEEIRLIGIRSVDQEEKHFVNELGIKIFDMRFINEHGMRQTMQQALEGIDADTHLHVSFDLDCLDPSVAPGVSTAEHGGLTYREVQLCMEMIYDTGCLGSLDIVELNPARDIRNTTAELAVELVESLFGKTTLARS